MPVTATRACTSVSVVARGCSQPSPVSRFGARSIVSPSVLVAQIGISGTSLGLPTCSFASGMTKRTVSPLIWLVPTPLWPLGVWATTLSAVMTHAADAAALPTNGAVWSR